jgi:uncharacterized membrane protein YsdA (DUF1294 family)
MHYLPLKIIIFIGLCALPVLGIRQMWIDLNFIWPAVIYVLVSLVTFFCYWSDKRRAQMAQRRISENSLHLFELLGGWPGALLAQQVFRHKTRKLSFQLLFWLIVAIHLAFWCDWLLTGGHYSAQLLKFLMGR